MYDSQNNLDLSKIAFFRVGRHHRGGYLYPFSGVGNVWCGEFPKNIQTSLNVAKFNASLET